SCSNLREINQIHAQLLLNGLLNEPFLHGQFVSSVALRHPNYLDYSTQILDQFDNPTIFAFNSMIRAHSKSSNPQKSFHFYTKILRSNHNPPRPDNYTFTFLVRSCAQLSANETGPGQAVHGAVLKHGFEAEPHVQSGLVYMYAELGLLRCSRKVFDGISEPDLVTLTAMVTACAKSGDVSFARVLFDNMPHKDPIAWNAMISGWRRTKGTGYSFWTEFNVVMVMHNLEAVAWLTALAFAAAFAFSALILRRCLHPRGLTLEEKMLNFDTRTSLLQCRPIGYFPHWYVRGPYA
ncbi:hypothetical protein U1Q18_030496, partial [Sarracenia purpurea var. burkii]